MNKINTPMVSVIMPIRNEANFITRSLGAVLAQNYPHEKMEVLIADGMSDDKTRDIITNLAATSAIHVQILDNPQKIVPTGFNKALDAAKGDIIVRVDGHTIIAENYVESCVNKLQTSDADNVGGKMNAISETYFGKVVAAATSSPFGVGGARFHYSNEEEYVDTVYMGAWWRSIFDKIGYFDETLVRNQDDEFNYRLRANGGKILLSPDIQSIYYNRSSLRSLFRQYFQYGMYKIRVAQKHPRQTKPRHFIPALLVIALLGGAILTLLMSLFRNLWLVVLISYAAANLLASIRAAKQTHWSYLFLLPSIFFTLQFSYGLGFLLGLFKFRAYWNFDDKATTQ